MLTNARFSSAPGRGMDWLGEALLNWGYLRAGLKRRPSVEDLPDHLRRDVGLLPRADRRADLRDWHW
jgi:hypothetical protein